MTLGKLWLAGVSINWAQMYTHEHRHRIPLPTYPFERQRYWIEPYKQALPINQQRGEDDTATEPTEKPGAVITHLHLRPILSGAYIAPRNEIENTIAQIWQELLGIELIGVYDNFFELGGHSLLSTQLMSRVYDTFQVQVQFRSLFAQPTIAELANTVLALMAGQIDDVFLTELEQLSVDEVQKTLTSE